MTDIEQGLKEAIAAGASAQAKRTRMSHGISPEVSEMLADSREKWAPFVREPGPLTAPQIFSTLETLTKQAYATADMAGELSTLLAGPGVSPEATPEPDASHTIFDRMGAQLLDLTRALEVIETEVKRSLGAVQP